MQRLLTVIIVVLVIGLAFFSGLYVGGSSRSPLAGTIFAGDDTLPPENLDMSSVWKVWNLLETRYVPTSTSTETTDQEKVWGMIQGLAGSLGDPYTVFLPPEEAQQFAEDISGNFQGVGMEIGMRDDTLTVVAPLEGTPAKKAGIQSGDKILRINGEPTDQLSVDQAVKIIRGERGTTVTLTIAREGTSELLEISIVRDVIEIPTIKTELRNDGVFVINLYNFSAISSTLFRDALREFVQSGSRRLILDLRGNPGGYLEASVDIASWFLPAGKVVVTEDYGEGQTPRIHRSRGYNALGDEVRIIVLVNQGSASASEILAGALQQHGVASLVGEQTFGKGSVQELLEVTPTSSLKVTIARWLTPNGTSISENGLTPDVVVEMTQEDFDAQKDPQLEKAVEMLILQ
jgi:carboxyl-terminal processing protease